MSLISAKNITRVYQQGEVSLRALDGVSFDIEPGSFVSFIGPSGSGKSTMLNLIGCLDKPTSGDLAIEGQDVTQLDRVQAAEFRGENIGIVFQDFNLLPVLTVYENVEFPLIMVRNLPPAQRRERVMDLLKAVGMEDKAEKYPGQISGGQKQRAAVARSLITNPKLVLADEPTANLDSENAFKIIELMRQMRDRFGTTFIFSTHDPKVIEVAEVTYKLVDGRLAGTGA
jgi:putative ABC transport system ATP-binding protein